MYSLNGGRSSLTMITLKICPAAWPMSLSKTEAGPLLQLVWALVWTSTWTNSSLGSSREFWGFLLNYQWNRPWLIWRSITHVKAQLMNTVLLGTGIGNVYETGRNSGYRSWIDAPSEALETRHSYPSSNICHPLLFFFWKCQKFREYAPKSGLSKTVGFSLIEPLIMSWASGSSSSIETIALHFHA